MFFSGNKCADFALKTINFIGSITNAIGLSESADSTIASSIYKRTALHQVKTVWTKPPSNLDRWKVAESNNCRYSSLHCLISANVINFSTYSYIFFRLSVLQT